MSKRHRMDQSLKHSYKATKTDRMSMWNNNQLLCPHICIDSEFEKSNSKFRQAIQIGEKCKDTNTILGLNVGAALHQQTHARHTGDGLLLNAGGGTHQRGIQILYSHAHKFVYESTCNVNWRSYHWCAPSVTQTFDKHSYGTNKTSQQRERKIHI